MVEPSIRLFLPSFYFLLSTNNGMENIKIPILMYHGIARPLKSGLRTCLCVPKWVFATQMWYLRFAGYTPINMAQLAACMRGDESFPDKPVVMTFDDGFENNYVNALPILRKYGFTATVYLVADRIGKTKNWSPDPRLKDPPIMTIEQIKEMAECGIDFGAHTFTHPHLTQIPPEQLVREVRDCKGYLEQLLGKPITTFCYPYGKTSYSEEIRQLVIDSGYQAACTTRSGCNYPDSDAFALKRLMPRSRTYIPKFAKLLKSP